MGSKGSQTTTTSQNQTYAPTGAGYLTNALDRAQNVANTPFNLPQAPVAGFSQDQQNAFNTVNNAQGMALPYINTAQNYFSPQGAAAFYNPATDAVTAQLKNIFGQQNVQNTGNLVQSAGGVGADRIAVGQANMANQQALAAGQTYAGLYQNAVQNAQNAGYGTAALGSQALNSVLQGAQAQLGTGGLQQQLSQAQLNAPYQWQVAQAQFPYQQSNFLSNTVGALAPGLGGTSYGTGTQTTPGPSLFSQILGGGAAAAGLIGGTGGFGSNGWLTGSNGIFGGGGGGAGQNWNMVQAPWGSYPMATAARGGAIEGYDDGGGVSDRPIDITKAGAIPQAQITHANAPMPQLNLNPPSHQSSGGGKGSGPGIGDIAKLAMMAAADGGAVPYADGGAAPYSFFKHRFPQGYDDGGDVPASFADRFDAAYGEPIRLDPAATDRWRAGVDADRAQGQSAQDTSGMVSAFAPTNDTSAALAAFPNVIRTGTSLPTTQGLSTRSLASARPPEPPPAEEEPPAQTPLPQVAQAALPAPASNTGQDFFKSPWAALTAAGLGIMGGTSPFAGVNIGQGGLQGLKMLQSQRESAQKDEATGLTARRLEQEAQHHLDQMKLARMPYKQLTKAQQLEAAKPFKIGVDKNGADIFGVRDPDHPGRFITPDGKQINASTLNSTPDEAPPAQPPAEPKRQVASIDDGVVPFNNAQVKAGPYDYSQDAPYIEKGMDVPAPQGIAGKSARALETDAENYLQTGKLPPVRGIKGPVAVAAQNYRNAVQNYAGAMAQSRGLTPEQTAEMWRTAPGMLRFILGADGRSTVALGTAVRHLETLKQYADAWASGNNRLINDLRAKISREFGAEAATNLQAAARIVGPEIIKAIGVAGAGGIEERADVKSAFDPSASPAQIAGAIGVTQRLLGGQLDGKRRQAAAAGVSEDKFKSLIGEKPYEILTNVEKQPVGGQHPAAPAVQRPGGVPEGSQYSPSRRQWRSPDGKQLYDAEGKPI